jgi:hypothetical protein
MLEAIHALLERGVGIMNANLQEVAQPAPSLGRDWKPFSDRLAAALSRLKEDQNLILEAEHRQRFVQFAASGASGVRAGVIVSFQQIVTVAAGQAVGSPMPRLGM